jgi:hypothetical protein
VRRASARAHLLLLALLAVAFGTGSDCTEHESVVNMAPDVFEPAVMEAIAGAVTVPTAASGPASATAVSGLSRVEHATQRAGEETCTGVVSILNAGVLTRSTGTLELLFPARDSEQTTDRFDYASFIATATQILGAPGPGVSFAISGFSRCEEAFANLVFDGQPSLTNLPEFHDVGLCGVTVTWDATVTAPGLYAWSFGVGSSNLDSDGGGAEYVGRDGDDPDDHDLLFESWEKTPLLQASWNFANGSIPTLGADASIQDRLLGYGIGDSFDILGYVDGIDGTVTFSVEKAVDTAGCEACVVADKVDVRDVAKGEPVLFLDDLLGSPGDVFVPTIYGSSALDDMPRDPRDLAPVYDIHAVVLTRSMSEAYSAAFGDALGTTWGPDEALCRGYAILIFRDGEGIPVDGLTVTVPEADLTVVYLNEAGTGFDVGTETGSSGAAAIVATTLKDPLQTDCSVPADASTFYFEATGSLSDGTLSRKRIMWVPGTAMVASVDEDPYANGLFDATPTTRSYGWNSPDFCIEGLCESVEIATCDSNVDPDCYITSFGGIGTGLGEPVEPEVLCTVFRDLCLNDLAECLYNSPAAPKRIGICVEDGATACSGACPAGQICAELLGQDFCVPSPPQGPQPCDGPELPCDPGETCLPAADGYAGACGHTVRACKSPRNCARGEFCVDGMCKVALPCQPPQVGPPCPGASECFEDGPPAIASGRQLCALATGGACEYDADCDAGEYCLGRVAAAGIDQPGYCASGLSGIPCSEDVDCTTGVCIFDAELGLGACTDPSGGCVPDDAASTCGGGVCIPVPAKIGVCAKPDC